MRFVTCVLVLLAPALAGAQAATVRDGATLRADPAGTALATLHANAPITRHATRGKWTEVTIDGFVNQSVVRGRNQNFALSAADGATLRAAPSRSGRALARLEGGMGFTRVSKQGDWLRVRRTAWVLTADLSASQRTAERARPRAATVAAAPRRANAPRTRAENAVVTQSAAGALAAPAPGDTASAAAFPAMPSLAVQHRAPLRAAPDGAPIATLDSTAQVATVARDRDWVRVRVEGWVRASELVPADTSVLASVSAADLRAQPDRYRGRTVRWRVQAIALQTADPLRKGMAPDEPYLLARGPGAENAMLYLALPPSLVDQARRLDPLTEIVVVARVRNGRSEPSGVPLLDVLNLAQQ